MPLESFVTNPQRAIMRFANGPAAKLPEPFIVRHPRNRCRHDNAPVSADAEEAPIERPMQPSYQQKAVSWFAGALLGEAARFTSRYNPPAVRPNENEWLLCFRQHLGTRSE
jgi:hypothetical protein